MAFQSPVRPIRERPVANAHGVLGLLLVVPAALMALVTLVLPTGQTILRSFETGGGLLGRTKFAGLDNYTHLLGQSDFWIALGGSLSLAIVPILVAVLIGPSLAAALHRAGTWPRRAGRLLLSLPLVVFSPVAIAAAWLMAQPDGGIATMFGSLRNTGKWTPTFPLITAAATFGVMCGLALLVFLPVLRGRAEGRSLTPTMIAVGSITVVTAVAVALQAFSFSQVLVGGKSATLPTMQYRAAYMVLDFGQGATIATVTGLILGVLGVVATIIAIGTGLRIELPATGRGRVSGPPTGPPREPVRDSSKASVGGVAIGLLALVVVVAITVVCSWPWLSAIFSTTRTPPIHIRQSTSQIYANTWIPPLLSAIVSVGTAFLAALGIGGLRPLGRRSEWLLLPFAPWLFVGIGPLGISDFENARRLGVINHFIGLLPPILLSVPTLLVLTLFCRSRSAQWRMRTSAGAPATLTFLEQVVLPALPLALLMGGATVLFDAHGLLWPVLVGTSPDTWTAPVALSNQLFQFGGFHPSVGVTTPILVVVVLFLALGALQIFYLDRLVITTGSGDETPNAAPMGTLPPMPMPMPMPQQRPGPGGYGPPPPPPPPAARPQPQPQPHPEPQPEPRPEPEPEPDS